MSIELGCEEGDFALGLMIPTNARNSSANQTTVNYIDEISILAGRTCTESTNVFFYVLTFDWQDKLMEILGCYSKKGYALRDVRKIDKLESQLTACQQRVHSELRAKIETLEATVPELTAL
ncbi:hypothetical protein HPB51_028814 [Rhipicephalus microplus]|uniref:Uncharacterized protein n=1 Tax=Rhipicephalus microplus TaxID=6941 RepID=A0A9J6CWA5_RHIMP|nr:hypothetical protein HPB51_028814 [Rhipicephalus microplus]